MDVEKARQQLAERQKRQKEEGRGRAYYNLPKTGRAVVRYLEQPDHSLGVVVGKHFNIPGIDRGVAMCLKEHWDKPCPIHQVLNKFEKFIDVEKYLCASQGLSAVLVLEDSENPQAVNTETPKIMQQNEYGYTDLLKKIISKEIGDITDPKTGAAVTYEREKKAEKWTRNIHRTQSPIASSEEKIQEIMKKVPDLSKIVKLTEKDIENCAKGAEALYDFLSNKINESKKDDAAKFAGAGASPAKPAEQPKAVEQPKPAEPVKQPEPAKTPEPVKQAEPAKPPEVPKTEAPVAAASAGPSPLINKPKSAPECWGNPAVYNKGDKKCILCVHQYSCEKVVTPPAA